VAAGQPHLLQDVVPRAVPRHPPPQFQPVAFQKLPSVIPSLPASLAGGGHGTLPACKQPAPQQSPGSWPPHHRPPAHQEEEGLGGLGQHGGVGRLYGALQRGALHCTRAGKGEAAAEPRVASATCRTRMRATDLPTGPETAAPEKPVLQLAAGQRRPARQRSGSRDSSGQRRSASPRALFDPPPPHQSDR
jgi:hypothetical protein